MKVRAAIASATAAALIAGGGAVVLAFPGIASARSTTHTLKFIAENKQMHTFSAKAGLLFGTFAVAQSSAPMHGVVTGGVGKFKGASGTILVKPANKAGTKFAVTIVYHT